jgi:hypothetical protein
MPEPTLQATALRYAAGDLSRAESTAFESRLGADQEARDALAEAVRLSAAALGQAPPAPDRTFRAAIRERLLGYCPAWLRRRAYRGHPFAWTALGAGAVAACTVIGLALANRPPEEGATPPAAKALIAPEQRAENRDANARAPDDRDAIANKSAISADGRSVAEIWAHLSTPEHVEKVHDDELKWKQKLRELGIHHPGRVVPASATRTDDH